MSLRQIRSDVSLDMLPDRDSLRDSAEDLNEFIQEKAIFFKTNRSDLREQYSTLVKRGWSEAENVNVFLNIPLAADQKCKCSPRLTLFLCGACVCVCGRKKTSLGF